MKYLVIGAIACIVLACNNDKTTGSCSEFTKSSISMIEVDTKYDVDVKIDSIADAIFRFRILPSSSNSDISNISTLDNGLLSFSLFAKANALSCVPPKYHERISHIAISSNSDFDEQYLSGSNLNNIFHVSFQNASIEDILYTQHLDIMGFTLGLDYLPTLDKVHDFTFDITLSNGRQFSLEVSNVTFE